MKKIYAFIAFFMFLGIAGNAFAAAPVVTLQAASNITQNSATLSAVITSSTPINNIFEYGTDPSFGSNTQSVYTSNKSINITGLNAGTNYYYRISVSNSDGSTVAPLDGNDNPSYYSFKTTGYTTPYVSTLGADNITTSSATLNGRVNTYGLNGSYYFRYYSGSSCASYLGNTSTQSLTGSSQIQYVTSSLNGLSAGQSYCSEIVAVINGFDISGGKVSFKTSSNTVNPPASCTITSISADNGSISSGSSTTIRWATNNCTSASLRGSAVSVNGTQSTGALYSTTSFTLNAYNSTTSDSETITVTVNGGSTNSCVINSFYANNNSVNYGGSTTLYWSTSNCTSASISNIGSVNVDGSNSTGTLYNTTTYTLNAWGNSTNDSKTITVTVNNNGCGNNCGGGYNYPSCYYSGTCYWNGTNWAYYNNQNNYPSCYYNSTCYWNGTTWVYSYNYNNQNTYPSCYYSGTCYCSSYSNCTYYQNNNTNPVSDNYTYNPHSPYTGGTKYVTQKLPARVNTVYIDQQVPGNPINQVVTSGVNNGYYGYYNNYDYTNDLMYRYGSDYNYENTNVRRGNLLTGSAGSNNGITLLNLLIVLIIIAGIVYFVRSNQQKELH